MMSATEKIIFILILIAGTQVTRFAPLVSPNIIQSVPPQAQRRLSLVIAIFLVGYCYRDVASTPEYLLRLGAGVMVILLELLFSRTLLSIFGATLCYMLAVRVMG